MTPREHLEHADAYLGLLDRIFQDATLLEKGNPELLVAYASVALAHTSFAATLRDIGFSMDKDFVSPRRGKA